MIYYSTIYDNVKGNEIRYNSIQFDIIRYNSMQFGAIPQFRTIPEQFAHILLKFLIIHSA